MVSMAENIAINTLKLQRKVLAKSASRRQDSLLSQKNRNRSVSSTTIYLQNLTRSTFVNLEGVIKIFFQKRTYNNGMTAPLSTVNFQSRLSNFPSPLTTLTIEEVGSFRLQGELWVLTVNLSHLNIDKEVKKLKKKVYISC